MLNDEGLMVPPDWDTWPNHGDEFDFDLDRIQTIICWDLDIDWLWEPDLDGIESDEVAQGPLLRVVNLHPRDWFSPFEDARRIPSPGPDLPHS